MPTHPRASTREHAVVGVASDPTPINDRRRPSVLKDATRGVGAGDLRNDELEVRVIVDGVRAERVGEGGKTNSVCAGVADEGT